MIKFTSSPSRFLNTMYGELIFRAGKAIQSWEALKYLQIGFSRDILNAIYCLFLRTFHICLISHPGLLCVYGSIFIYHCFICISANIALFPHLFVWLLDKQISFCNRSIRYTTLPFAAVTGKVILLLLLRTLLCPLGILLVLKLSRPLLLLFFIYSLILIFANVAGRN